MKNGRRERFLARSLALRAVRFARGHAVLVVAAFAALATVPLVPPDEAYLGYFDVKTLSCLFGILAVVGALRRIGLFEHAARLLVERFATCRSAVAALVGATLVLSMFATNDMALVMMLPLSAATLLKAGWEGALPFAFIMQNLAANLGGMILPFGNPQNLYLYERFSIPLGDFLSVMALPFAVSVALIALCCALLAKPDASRATKKPAPKNSAMKNSRETARVGKSRTACTCASGSACGRACEDAHARMGESAYGHAHGVARERARTRGSARGAACESFRREARTEQKAAARAEQKAEARTAQEAAARAGQEAEARTEAPRCPAPLQRTNVSRETFAPEQGRAVAQRIASARRARALAYVALLVLVVASVLRIVPYPVAVAAVAVALAVLDRRALRSVDWGLLLTFGCFFVFAGNLARVPAVEAFFSFWMNESALLVGAGASQIISNVPAAVLLSHFTDGYAALLVGVNVGGAGTLVASLASLITFNEYRAVRRGFPGRPALARVTPGAYLVRFTAYNAAFLAVLLIVCAPFV